MSPDDLPAALARVARDVYARHLSTSSGGNVSHRHPGGFLVSGTGRAGARQTADDFALCGPDGAHVSGPAPSKEAGFHAALYRQRPDVHAAVHVHADASLALSCLAEPTSGNVLPILSSYAVTTVGRAPLLPYHPPGSAALAAAVHAACVGANALLFQNHGVLVYAETLEQALDRLEELEQQARVWLLTRGQARVLSEAELAAANHAAGHRFHVPAGEARPRLRADLHGWSP
ncbi:ribulose-5-phosphate 4-epimerase/fuculose-1-phosphate aldolase [Deinococcus metalli]|uniref:Fructose-bisphosphate aldolase n=1 Tax=Deinococcus metalli TaxID=1141878 RepID=A0A7W8NRK8_9DEIO|nr:class II aldolase/adducin family protein [Deinococcus metalli]MBB5377990.1 ribulose-5-phosphate 4-epimerase/fuculose-1-phosphate aldolase [Deinococcus metalli]GHF53601.1 fructose-bisphosphate aldolase [Deinococcus metalli]